MRRHSIVGPALAAVGVELGVDACGASLTSRCFRGEVGCRVHPVVPPLEVDVTGMAPELEVVLERQRHAAAVAAVDWDAFRRCTTCQRPTGRPCVARSGRVVAGRPDGVETELEQPHAHRKRRVGR